MEIGGDSQKRLVSFFKQFVNTALIKHFKNSTDTMGEWDYFSSLISQNIPDLDKIQRFLEVLETSKDEVSSPLKTNFQPKFKTFQENKKTNSGIYGKKQQSTNQMQRIDFQLTRTVGGNADRIKFTGMLSQKSNPLSFNGQRKKQQPTQHRPSSLSNLIQNISTLTTTMQQNHSKLQHKNQILSPQLISNSYSYK